MVAGCNQATNRDPVMDLDESEVERALVSLHDAQLATPVRRSGDRATKYRHKLAETLEIDDRQQAVLAVLLLRGPQTSGELRTRTERYVQFGSVEEVEEVVDRLAEASLVERMPRSPGQSQRRIRQLLAEEGAPDPAPVESASPSDLEARVSELEARFARLLESLGVDDI